MLSVRYILSLKIISPRTTQIIIGICILLITHIVFLTKDLVIMASCIFYEPQKEMKSSCLQERSDINNVT